VTTPPRKRRPTWGWAAALSPEERHAYIHGRRTEPQANAPKQPKVNKRTAPKQQRPDAKRTVSVESRSFQRAIFEYLGVRYSADDLTRPVFVTPYEGAYGCAGYVISVNGTPPRTVLLVIGSEDWLRPDDCLMCFVFPDPRNRLRWLQPYTGGPHWEVRRAVVHLLHDHGFERPAA
jgi:hypothetical protein